MTRSRTSGNLEFDPDRWLPDRVKDVPKHAMSPFSVGNRKCPSDHFSMAQLTLITAALSTKYRFEQVAGSNDAHARRHHAPAARPAVAAGARGDSAVIVRPPRGP